jgi:glucose-6-phosphate isomerase
MEYERNFYQIKSDEYIYNKLVLEKNTIGYYSLPYIDTSSIKTYAKKVKQKYILVIGIGGSSLGASAIYDFMIQSNTYSKELYFLESTDPLDIQSILNKIDIDNTLFIAISKSGTTIETIANLKYVSSNISLDKNNCVIISEKYSKLTQYANIKNMTVFEIPKNVGGRFSVFSNAGLLPLAIIGINIDYLLEGCKKIDNSYFSKNEVYKEIMQKARFMVENKNRFNINVIFSYSQGLAGFNKWYIQLWAESLGKININGTKQALTPIGLIGPVDQHSFLQLIMEGTRDKTVTFIKINDFGKDLKIPNITLDGLEDMDYINNLSYSQLLNEQANATIKSVQDQKTIPCDVITIEKVDEYNIGTLMYSYQLLTSIIGQYTQIDTYNQPGVEFGKVILKDKLR